ncbi:MAG: class II fumarate hydratase [Clostridia bacterium]|nr:class II fumarate hydratase [Clostridia bacterium]
MNYRIERDTMGEMRVPAEALWGAQTQRSLENFRVGREKMPPEVIEAFAYLKEACAVANQRQGKLDGRRAELIAAVCREIRTGALSEHFPLSVWQTGSGTQTNMNVNEVIANRGNILAGEKLLHPNDHANMSQSSNDTFPTAMHVAAVMAMEKRLLPPLAELIACFKRLEEENFDVIKTGRTHLQDATPLRFSQEISGWRVMLEKGRDMVTESLAGLRELALGGTAVGTGINAPKGFSELAISVLSDLTGTAFCGAENKFHALTARDALVYAHGALKALAANYFKLTTDIRFLSSGPRCGLGEIYIPENEPGSSIMPGKVNPTQCESAAMVALQVMANDNAVAMAASQGNFELNVYMPLTIHNFLQSVTLLGDSFTSFRKNCAEGIKPNREKMQENLDRSLMQVTALNAHIGYDKAAKVAKTALAEELSLKEAALKLGYMDGEALDQALDPEKMV